MKITNLRSEIIFLLPFVLFTTISGAYEVTAVQNGGNLTGKIVFSGSDPAPQPFSIDKDTDVCGSSQEIDYVRVSDGKLADVIVYLEDIKSGKDYSDEQAEIEQNGCKFWPFVSIAINGQNLTVHNLDAVAHNVHTYELIGSAKRTAFNVNQPDQGSVLTKKVKLRRGNTMKLECDQHDFMHGFVFVAKNPYYAVVSENGDFRIDGIPPGSYTVKAWHNTLGQQEASVEITGGGTTEQDFAFQGK
jgi:carboxypeptidase family protein